MPDPGASWIHVSPDGIVFTVHVQPGARSTEASGWHGEMPKIRLAAPARDGEANAELIRFLSRALGVAKSGITIISGQTSRTKRVSISGEGRLLEDAVHGLLQAGQRGRG